MKWKVQIDISVFTQRRFGLKQTWALHQWAVGSLIYFISCFSLSLDLSKYIMNAVFSPIHYKLLRVNCMMNILLCDLLSSCRNFPRLKFPVRRRQFIRRLIVSALIYQMEKKLHSRCSSEIIYSLLLFHWLCVFMMNSATFFQRYV